jgi:CubicO group peptidase (beta-lactamase class C family)
MSLKFFRLAAAIATIQCVERGLIGLDDPISKHLRDLQSGVVIAGWKEVGGSGTPPLLRPAETQMTFRQMLNHTSGISSRIFDP